MKQQRIGIIMHGVTGRMGMNQHLIRSVLAIRDQGGVVLGDGTHLVPDPIIVGRNAEEVEHRYQQAVELVSIEDAIVALGRPFNDHDFSQYPLDAPFPELGDLGANSQKGGSDRIKQQAREHHLTLRQVALDFSRPRREFVGTPEQVADQIQHWFENGASDGFIINSLLPDGLKYFTELVIPVLQKRGLQRSDYTGTTLREHFGLPFPVNRYTAARASTAPVQTTDRHTQVPA